MLTALRKGFEQAEAKGRVRKAIIFTESTRTQEYLRNILENTEYTGRIVLFNGSNTDKKSREIYQNWLNKNQGTDHVTGSKTADMRSALVDYFRDEAVIMIATEAGAEGINLQFLLLCPQLRSPLEPAAYRTAHWPVPPVRPETRCRGGQFPQQEHRRLSRPEKKSRLHPVKCPNNQCDQVY